MLQDSPWKTECIENAVLLFILEMYMDIRYHWPPILLFSQTRAICPQNESAFLFHFIVSYHMRLTNLPSFLENDRTSVFSHTQKKKSGPNCSMSVLSYKLQFLFHTDSVRILT